MKAKVDLSGFEERQAARVARRRGNIERVKASPLPIRQLQRDQKRKRAAVIRTLQSIIGGREMERKLVAEAEEEARIRRLLSRSGSAIGAKGGV